MGFIDLIKGKLNSSRTKAKMEELNSYLLASKNNLKLAYENVGKFLDGVKDFQPARRHEALYHEEVRGRLISMRSGMRNCLIFLDERSNNTINTLNPIKSVDQLRQMLAEWHQNISADDEKTYGILKILQVEMWGAERVSRGFPVPRNKEILCGNLGTALTYMNEARSNLDAYASLNSLPEA